MKEIMKGERNFDGTPELERMEKRIEEYRRKSMERIEAEYKYLSETVKQLKKEIGKN